MGFLFCWGLLDRQVSVSVDGYSESQILVIVSFNSHGSVTFGKAIFREVQITLGARRGFSSNLKSFSRIIINAARLQLNIIIESNLLDIIQIIFNFITAERYAIKRGCYERSRYFLNLCNSRCGRRLCGYSSNIGDCRSTSTRTGYSGKNKFITTISGNYKFFLGIHAQVHIDITILRIKIIFVGRNIICRSNRFASGTT